MLTKSGRGIPQLAHSEYAGAMALISPLESERYRESVYCRPAAELGARLEGAIFISRRATQKYLAHFVLGQDPKALLFAASRDQRPSVRLTGQESHL